MAKAFLVVGTILLFYHVVGSLLIWLVKLEKKWIPALDFMFALPIIDETEPYDGWLETTDTKFYLAMMYEAALCFSLVEFNPRTALEIFVVTVVMLLSAIINA